MTQETTTVKASIDRDGRYCDAEFNRRINEMGKDGWKLVQVLADEAEQSKTAYLVRNRE